MGPKISGFNIRPVSISGVLNNGSFKGPLHSLSYEIDYSQTYWNVVRTCHFWVCECLTILTPSTCTLYTYINVCYKNIRVQCWKKK